MPSLTGVLICCTDWWITTPILTKMTTIDLYLTKKREHNMFSRQCTVWDLMFFSLKTAT